MKIILSGVNTDNKGAELMLYAILHEIEEKYPDAKVYIPYSRVKQGIDYVHTNLNFRYTPFSEFASKAHLYGIAKKMHIPLRYYWKHEIIKDADWFIDGSGFSFSDQWNIKDERVSMWKYKLETLYYSNCKIVFLPQAFGPVEQPNTKKALSILNDYATVIMPRERISYDYLVRSGVIDMKKVITFTDFTSLVEGTFPSRYEALRNGICIIPNMRMIDKGAINFDNYVNLLLAFVREGKKSGYPVYLLNHEGIKDEQLAYRCRKELNNEVEVVTRLNALEVKGMIASSYLVITSRFHGLASALNSCVPCLATSWSHKYEELFRDYGLNGYVLPKDNISIATSCMKKLLDTDENQKIRRHLVSQLPKIKEETRRMWDFVWDV